MSAVPYISLGDQDRAAMLAAVGVESLDELFAHIHEPFSSFDLPEGVSEWELLQTAHRRAAANTSPLTSASFVGAGVYDHWYPAVIDTLVGRTEFLTAYTPYQPELSQGVLQAMYEFQTCMTRLYGMEVSNASVYDGANALVESVMMALRVQRLSDQPSAIVVSEGVHPEYLEVLTTHLAAHPSVSLVSAPLDAETGETLWGQANVPSHLKTAAVIGQFPNFFGVLDPMHELADAARALKSLSVVVNVEPYACVWHEPPGAFGVDIVAAELQGWGSPPALGGPHIGVMLTHKKNIRQLPGRIVGKTKTVDGAADAYALILSTREQHIRRERATSNICSNQGLMTCRVLAHAALLGANGLAEAARQNVLAAGAAFEAWSPYCRPLFPQARFFNEFAFALTPKIARVADTLTADRVFWGARSDIWKRRGYEKPFLLAAVTEKTSPESIARVTETLKGACA